VSAAGESLAERAERGITGPTANPQPIHRHPACWLQASALTLTAACSSRSHGANATLSDLLCGPGTPRCWLLQASDVARIEKRQRTSAACTQNSIVVTPSARARSCWQYSNEQFQQHCLVLATWIQSWPSSWLTRRGMKQAVQLRTLDVQQG
jgi:hypothetical protein